MVGLPVTASRRSAQKSYIAVAARDSAGTFVKAYTHPRPTAAYALSNTGTPVITSPSLVMPWMVLMAVSKSTPRFAAGSYVSDAMSTKSSFPRPPSCARRKFTSRTQRGQSPSKSTRTSQLGRVHGVAETASRAEALAARTREKARGARRAQSAAARARNRERDARHAARDAVRCAERRSTLESAIAVCDDVASLGGFVTARRVFVLPHGFCRSSAETRTEFLE